MNKTRKDLDIQSSEQEKTNKEKANKEKPKTNYPSFGPTKSSQNRPKKQDEKTQPEPIVCKNCGQQGHFVGMCTTPRKPGSR